MGVLALVGTRKGLFLLRAGDLRDSWQVEGPLLDGWGVFHAIVDERDSTIFAAANHLVYGPTVQRSSDGGKTWRRSQQISAGGFGILEAQALTGRIEESFIRRISSLEDDARRLLLVAAADPVGDPLLLLRACERLGIFVSALDADADGLLTVGERVTFRHPLVRSAVYRSADVQERRAVHRALADATDREVDPDRRAWHLAAAAAWPDDTVALELERSAGRAQARGGVAAAAAFLERATALTLDPARQVDRALAGAQASIYAGAFDAALRLAATAEARALDEFQRARVDLIRAQLAFAASRGSEATPRLLAAARRLEGLDASLARETYLDAFSAALFGARLNETVGLTDVARAASAAPRTPGCGSAVGRARHAGRRLRSGSPPLSGSVGDTLWRSDLGGGTTAVVVAGLRCRTRSLGRRERVLAVAASR